MLHVEQYENMCYCISALQFLQAIARHTHRDMQLCHRSKAADLQDTNPWAPLIWAFLYRGPEGESWHGMELPHFRKLVEHARVMQGGSSRAGGDVTEALQAWLDALLASEAGSSTRAIGERFVQVLGCDLTQFQYCPSGDAVHRVSRNDTVVRVVAARVEADPVASYLTSPVPELVEDVVCDACKTKHAMVMAEQVTRLGEVVVFSLQPLSSPAQGAGQESLTPRRFRAAYDLVGPDGAPPRQLRMVALVIYTAFSGKAQDGHYTCYSDPLLEGTMYTGDISKQLANLKSFIGYGINRGSLKGDGQVTEQLLESSPGYQVLAAYLCTSA